MYSQSITLKSKHFVIACLLLLFLALQPLMADDKSGRNRPDVLGVAQIVDILRRQGFHSFEEIEYEGRYYEVEARDAKGREVEIEIDARTGTILDIEYDD